jgi:hypothetical protein
VKPVLLTRANTGAICFVIKGFQLARGSWEWHDQHSQGHRSAAAISRGTWHDSGAGVLSREDLAPTPVAGQRHVITSMVLPWTLQMRSELELTKSQSQRSLVILDVILIKPRTEFIL